MVKIEDLKGTEREVKCPSGAFTSNRVLLESDNMGFSLTKTVIPKGKWQQWHYKNHLEACYCIQGVGLLREVETDTYYDIRPDTIYILGNNDRHEFMAIQDVVLVCVFNPPLKGREIHDGNGSYS